MVNTIISIPGYVHLYRSLLRFYDMPENEVREMLYLLNTANLDSFWSLLKRGVMGTYHNVSKAYLPLYLAEFSFRHNNRKNADIFTTVVASC